MADVLNGIWEICVERGLSHHGVIISSTVCAAVKEIGATTVNMLKIATTPMICMSSYGNMYYFVYVKIYPLPIMCLIYYWNLSLYSLGLCGICVLVWCFTCLLFFVGFCVRVCERWCVLAFEGIYMQSSQQGVCKIYDFQDPQKSIIFSTIPISLIFFIVF